MNKGHKSDKTLESLSLESRKRVHSGNRSAGKTYLTRKRRSTAKIELMRLPSGERREKTLLAKSESLEAMTVSIQPLGELGGLGQELASSKPKSLQIRVGKAMEKKWRDWSGECDWRKKSMEAQVDMI